MNLFKKRFRPVFITTKSIFIITLIVIALTICVVWLQGLHLDRSLLRNSLLSTSILSSFLFLFMTIGLYKGYKLKDNVGKITDRFDLEDIKGIQPDWLPDGDIDLDIGDGCGGLIAGIIIWFFAAIVVGILVFLLGTMLWFSILLLFAMLYWIFFRGLRLVFKKSKKCQGDIFLSVRYAGAYTLFATAWLVIILFIFEHGNYSLIALGSLF